MKGLIVSCNEGMFSNEWYYGGLKSWPPFYFSYWLHYLSKKSEICHDIPIPILVTHDTVIVETDKEGIS